MSGRFIAYLLITILLSTNFSILDSKSNSRFDADPYEEPVLLSSSEKSKLDDCLDSSLVFVNCDNYVNRNNYLGADSTILVIDDGIHPDTWEKLEFNLEDIEVDIIAYVTTIPTSSEEYVVGRPGIDALTLPDDYYDVKNPDQSDGKHGPAVISAIAQIARKVNIVFVDIDLGSGGDGWGFSYKYPSHNEMMWNWIIDNIDTYGIDLISVSASFKESENFVSDFITNELVQKGVMMITSSGNAGNLYNVKSGDQYFWPNKDAGWYTIGSIDHENRGETVASWCFNGYLLVRCHIWDEDYYSKQGYYSGAAIAGWTSSWGSSTYGDASLDWLMPGNGVPVYYDMGGNGNPIWYYDQGTSFSAPYFAAAAIIAIDGYKDGLEEAGEVRYNPSISTLISILSLSDSRSTFNQRWGYGYIDVDLAYQNAFDLGYEFGQ